MCNKTILPWFTWTWCVEYRPEIGCMFEVVSSRTSSLQTQKALTRSQRRVYKNPIHMCQLMWMMIRVVVLIFSKFGETPYTALYQSDSNIVKTCHNHLQWALTDLKRSKQNKHRGLVCHNPQLLRGLDIDRCSDLGLGSTVWMGVIGRWFSIDRDDMHSSLVPA